MALPTVAAHHPDRHRTCSFRGEDREHTGHDRAELTRNFKEAMTTTYSRARGVLPHENGSEQRNGGPSIIRNGFGPTNGRADHNNSCSSSAVHTSKSAINSSSSVGGKGGGSISTRLGNTAVSAGHSLAYTYSPLEHSSDPSWHQIPKNLASAVLGVDPVGDHAGGGVGSGGGAGGTMSHQSKTYKMAVKRTVMSVALSCCFGLATMVFRGRQSGLEFFAGYLVEQSLSEYQYTDHPTAVKSHSALVR